MLGNKGYLGIGLQADKGTGVVPTIFVPFLGESILTTPELIPDTRIRALAQRLPHRLGLTTHGGSFSIEVDPTTFGYFLRSLYGEPTTTQPEGATKAYQHVFKRPRSSDWHAGAPLPLCSLDVSRIPGANSDRYVDCAILGMTMKCGPDQHILTAEFNVAALGKTSQAVTATSYPTLSPYTIATSSVTKGGGAFADDMESFEYKYDSKIEPRVSMAAVAGPSRFREIDDPVHTLAMSVEPVDGDELAVYLAGTTAAFQIKFEGKTIEETTKESLQIDFAAVQYSAYPFNLKGRGTVVIPATSDVFYESGAGYDVQVTLINEVASYAASA